MKTEIEKLKEKIKKRIEEIENEQKMHETCRVVCIGAKAELQAILDGFTESESNAGEEAEKAGDDVEKNEAAKA